MRNLLFVCFSGVALISCGRGPLGDVESLSTETGSESGSGDGDGDGDPGDGDGDPSTTFDGGTSIDGGIDWGDEGDGDGDGDPTDGPGDPSDTGEPQPQDEAHGMTWVVTGSNPDLGVVLVGSDDFTDAYVGDTLCTEVLPMLCIDTAEWFDNPGVMSDFYHGWTGRRVALTSPLGGTDLTSVEDANLICSEELGSSFRMAEFHDGFGGWHWWGYASLEQLTPEVGRFWVRINDQPANCWNWSP